MPHSLLIRMICLVVLLIGAPASSEEVVLGKDSRLLFPSDFTERYAGKVPTGKEGERITPGSAILEKGGRKTTKIEIVRVIPIRGNNPVNQQDPINNATIDGRLYFTAVDELEQLVKNGGDTPGPAFGSGCIGKQVDFKATAGFTTCLGPKPIYGAGINLNFDTGACSLIGGDSGWNFMGFDIQVPVTSKDCKYNEAAAFPDFANAELTPPTGSGFQRINIAFGKEYIFYLKPKKAPHNTMTIKVYFTVKKLGETSFQLTVSNMTKQ